MKALIIFDSNFGNAKIIAEIIAKELNEAEIISVSNFTPKLLENVELLIVGGPINWWRPSIRMREFLLKLKNIQLSDIKAASFDTRAGSIFPFNDAMKRISRTLRQSGAQIVAAPQYFKVTDKKGPLKDGEIKKAMDWAVSIKEKTCGFKIIR